MSELKDILDINIPDNGDMVISLPHLMTELEDCYSSFSTHSMNCGALFLQGQKDMLRQIIEYLDVL